MAVTVTILVPIRENAHRVSVIATQDADTTATIPHGLGVVPRSVAITALLQAPAALSAWAATTINATNVVLTKGVGVGSGNAGAQVQVEIFR
jgi:hypothetical protein